MNLTTTKKKREGPPMEKNKRGHDPKEEKEPRDEKSKKKGKLFATKPKRFSKRADIAEDKDDLPLSPGDDLSELQDESPEMQAEETNKVICRPAYKDGLVSTQFSDAAVQPSVRTPEVDLLLEAIHSVYPAEGMFVGDIYIANLVVAKKTPGGMLL